MKIKNSQTRWPTTTSFSATTMGRMRIRGLMVRSTLPCRSLRDACVVATFDTRESTILGDDLPVRHLLVEFDGKFQRQVEGHYEKVHSLARTTQAGTGAAALLGALGYCIRLPEAGRSDESAAARAAKTGSHHVRRGPGRGHLAGQLAASCVG